MTHWLLAAVSIVALASSSGPDWWPQWRGPDHVGVAHGDAPLRWSDTENIKWKAAIAGRGHSSPVIWGDRIFLTTAVPRGPKPKPLQESPAAGEGAQRRGPDGDTGPQAEHQFDVIALDRRTGHIVWQKTAKVATPHEGHHRVYGSFASNSPITDGRRVWAFFGSRGLYCYDWDGRLLWEKDFGVQMRMRLGFGEGSAPFLSGDRIFLNFDQQKDSFVVAVDAGTGRELWRAARDEESSWSMPFVVEHRGKKQVVLTGTNKVRSYDIANGKLIWEAAGLGGNTIPSPVQYGDLVLVMSGFRNPNLMAIRLGREGDLTGTDAIVWTNARGTSYTPSPVLHDGKFYFLTDTGMLSCFDASTGQPYYHQVRLPKAYNFKASPITAGGKLYLASENEDVVVVKIGQRFEVLATNTLAGETFIATPAVADGEIYLRGKNTLYAIAGKP